MYTCIFILDLLLLQDIIRAPLNANVDILVRQVSSTNVHETLKEVEKRGYVHIIAQLNIDDSKALLKAVRNSVTCCHCMLWLIVALEFYKHNCICDIKECRIC